MSDTLNPPMLLGKDIQQLASGSFELRFKEMRLRRCGPDDSSIPAGPGIVRQTEHGDLTLAIFLTRDAPTFVEIVKTESGLKAGELLPDAGYYDLEAEDYSGRLWEASRILVRFIHSIFGQATIAEATLTELLGRGKYPNSGDAYVEIRYRGNPDFPFTLPIHRVGKVAERTIEESIAVGVAEFSALDCNFFVQHDSGYLFVSAGSREASLPSNIEDRINEALEFLLARRLTWATVTKIEGANASWRITGAPTHKDRDRGRMQFPVIFKVGNRASCESALSLLSHFLVATCHHKGGSLPPLSIAVRMALESSHSPLDAHALDLSVAVEALLGSHFNELGRPTNDYIQELRVICKAISELEISESTRKRIEGLLNLAKSGSSKDKLRALISQGKVTSEDLRAWETVRHKAAHGVFLKDVNQKYVDSFLRVMTLFYRLIFHAIGYFGPYQDYGTPGWPVRTPNPKPADSDLQLDNS
jgi:hypothetical protein